MRTISGAWQAITLKQEVERISGFVNTCSLHETRHLILACHVPIERHDLRYRQAGGKKSLDEIK
jgi:hypothetical protein